MTAQKFVNASIRTNSKKKVPDKVFKVALLICASSAYGDKNHLGHKVK